MKPKSIKSAILLSSVIALTAVQSVPADPPKIDPDRSLENLDNSKNSQDQVNLKAVNINGKGTVTYKGQEVWKGEVKSDQLTAIAKASNGKESKYSEGTELAAVWDGDKLVWENIHGAANDLQPEFQKARQKAKELKDALDKMGLK